MPLKTRVGLFFLLLWTSSSPAVCFELYNARLTTYTVDGNDIDSYPEGTAAVSSFAPVLEPRGISMFPRGGGANSIQPSIAPVPSPKTKRAAFVTETVYGFLDFTTTIGSTVMVFTPESKKAIKPPASSSSRKYATQTRIDRPTSTVPPRRFSIRPSQSYKVSIQSEVSSSVSFSTKPFRYSSKKNKKPEEPKRKQKFQSGGSTIVPITIEGTHRPTRTPILEPSIYIPKEVVISAHQTFPTLSLIGPLKSDVNNAIGESDYPYDYYENFPQTSSYKDLAPFNSNIGSRPTGLVTTFGGTTVSDGQTTIYETSVMGTYVSGKYAQIHKSTSKIFRQASTQLKIPQVTESLPIESLFSVSPDQNANLEEREAQFNAQLSNRQGVPSSPDDQYDYNNQYYEDYYDQYPSGAIVRSSYKPNIPPIRPTPANTYYNKKTPSTFRARLPRPGSTRNNPPSFKREPPKLQKELRPSISRWRTPTPALALSRPKVTTKRKPFKPVRPVIKPVRPVIKPIKPAFEDYYYYDDEFVDSDYSLEPTQPEVLLSKGTEEIVKVETSYPSGPPSNTVYEISTLRSLHTFRLGTTENTRYVTYTKTFTKTIKPTSALQLTPSSQKVLKSNQPLFENILEKPKLIATLPVIDLKSQSITDILKTSTESFSTVETMYKTSVLPVRQSGSMSYYTLTQSYLITRVVTAVKTMPPADAFRDSPNSSFNEFNDKLLAEGTENDASLLPGELEHNLNEDLSNTGKFNPDEHEKQNQHQSLASKQTDTPQLKGTIETDVVTPAPAAATPAMTPEQLQLAYYRLYNPFLFGGMQGVQQQMPAFPQISVVSSAITITTDVTTVSERVFNIIFNARPIKTTISSTTVIQTTLTSYTTTTITSAPSIPGFGGNQGFGRNPGFPGGFQFPQMPFGVG